MNQIDTLRKGKSYVEMIILAILCEGDYYGYQICQLITSYSKDIISVQEGTLYPAFYRLVDGGYITEEKQNIGRRRTRVYYHIEPAGRKYLDSLICNYNQLNEGIQNILQRVTS